MHPGKEFSSRNACASTAAPPADDGARPTRTKPRGEAGGARNTCAGTVTWPRARVHDSKLHTASTRTHMTAPSTSRKEPFLCGEHEQRVVCTPPFCVETRGRSELFPWLREPSTGVANAYGEAARPYNKRRIVKEINLRCISLAPKMHAVESPIAFHHHCNH